MNKSPKTYKDLIIWQKSFEVATLVIKLVRKLPKSPDIRIITNQVLRSVMSIGANIAEGYGSYGTKEYSRFLQIALGSANESDYWLSLLKVSVPTFSKEIDVIIEKNTETIKMLARSIKTIGSKRTKK